MPPSCGSTNGRVNEGNFIEHNVTKFDTLAGVAIKYGVEVSDLKRLNGLSSDLQMFALKTLRIPLPGRHPPSSHTISPDGSNNPFSGIEVEDNAKFISSFSFMDKKQTPKIKEPRNPSVDDPTSDSLTERLLHKGSSSSDPLLSEGVERSMEKFVRRRQKGDLLTPEKVIKEEVSPLTAQRLSMRGKSGDQRVNVVAVGLGDCLITDGFSVRKSSSTSSLNEQETNGSSLWATPKWNLKQDLQTLSSVGISIPIFDGLPKPISAWKTKAALD